MKETYAKTILYAYPHVDKLKLQIDDLIEKKALASMNDYSPAILQCEKIIALIFQKDLMDRLKEICDKILSKFSSDDLKCFDYKYFKKKPREIYLDFDSSSRAYFRKQIRLVKQFASRLEKQGLNDLVFEKDFLQINFFKELLKRVVEHDDKVNKARGVKRKIPLKKIA